MELKFSLSILKKTTNSKPKYFLKALEIKNLSIYFDIETNLVNLFKLRGIAYNDNFK